MFDDEVYAASSRGTQAARAGTLQRLLAPWQVPLLPLSSDKIRLLGAALKAGGFRSAVQYLATAVRLGAQPTGGEGKRGRQEVLHAGGLAHPTRLPGSHSERSHNCLKLVKLKHHKAPWPQHGQSSQGRGGCSARLCWPQPEHR